MSHTYRLIKCEILYNFIALTPISALFTDHGVCVTGILRLDMVIIFRVEYKCSRRNSKIKINVNLK